MSNAAVSAANLIWRWRFPLSALCLALVSAGAAIGPAWASESELTYVSTESGSLMLATLEFGESVRVTRTALFDHSPYVRGIPSWRAYDVSRDGQRFIFTRSLSRTEARSPVVVLNWMEEVWRVMAGGSGRIRIGRRARTSVPSVPHLRL